MQFCNYSQNITGKCFQWSPKAVVTVSINCKVRLLTCSTLQSRRKSREFAISSHAFVRTSLSLHPSHDLSKKTGKLWFISNIFSFYIKLILISVMAKNMHTTLFCTYTYFFSNKHILALNRPHTWSAPLEF